MGTLDKKVIVTADVSDLTEEAFYTNVKGKVQAQIDNPAIVPNLSPTAQAVMTKITTYKQTLDDRKALMQQVKQKTSDAKTQRKELNGNMVDDWAKQIQTAVAGDIGKVQVLHFGVKNVDDGQAASTYNITNSHPIITGVETGNFTHTLSFKNNKTGKFGLPEDVDHIDVYEFFGDTAPTNIKKMSYLGTAKRGKFTNHFTPDQLGQNVWYAVIYIGKASAGVDSSELSPIVKSTVM